MAHDWSLNFWSEVSSLLSSQISVHVLWRNNMKPLLDYPITNRNICKYDVFVYLVDAACELTLFVSCWAHLTLLMSKESTVLVTLAISSLLWAL